MIDLIEIKKGTVVNPANILAISETKGSEGEPILEFVFQQGGLQVPHTPELEKLLAKHFRVSYLADNESSAEAEEVLPV